MIAKSDLIILVISASALGLGIYRWQQNTAAPAVASRPADVRAAAPRQGEPLVGRPADAPRTDPPVPNGTSRTEEAVPVRRVPPPDAEPSGTGERAPAAGAERVPLPEPPRNPDARTSLAADATAAEANGAQALYGTYRVRSGDYLGRIADRFGTSVATLREINGIEGNLILVDQELRYPLPAN